MFPPGFSGSQNVAELPSCWLHFQVFLPIRAAQRRREKKRRGEEEERKEEEEKRRGACFGLKGLKQLVKTEEPEVVREGY